MSKRGKKRVIGILGLIVLGLIAFFLYQKFFGSIHLNKNYTFIYVEKDDQFEDVIEDINSEGIIKDLEAFKWLAKKMDLDQNIHPGKYRILNGMSMRQIINLIKYNKQEKIKLTYNSQIHTLDDFVSYTADKLDLTEGDLEDYLADDKKLQKDFGLDPDNAFALIVPGVYEVSWAISTEEFFDFLKNKYKAVWNDNRKALARNTGYSIPEIITLASIVQNESAIESEQEKIAGVYINRLKQGMPLQADPTLRFATRKFDAQRFYNSDKDNDSPYNTYKFKGLPPGPVSLVGVQAIDATLNYQKHKYMYFCANCKFNGYSEFAVTYEQHRKNAEAYQKELDKRGIR